MHEGGSQVPFTDGGSEVRGEKPATSLRWGCPGEGQSPIRGCAGAPLEQGGGGGGGGGWWGTVEVSGTDHQGVCSEGTL